MGLTGKFGTYWKFKFVSQLSNDRNAYPGDYRQWGHETFRAANITFDAGQFWQIEGLDSLQIGYGRRTGRMADEWQRSSTLINCLERSSLANKLWLYDKEKGNPLAVGLSGQLVGILLTPLSFQAPMMTTLVVGKIVKYITVRGSVISRKAAHMNSSNTGFHIINRMVQSRKIALPEATTGHWQWSTG